MKKVLLFLIKIYQYALSPLWPAKCRFYPSCSEYAKEAILRFGCLKGSYLFLRRFLRCNPFFEGGIDPVPQQFYILRRKKIHG
ncbi:MAG: uncharacterized protein PWR24_912 [Desulfonauticus sp.]|jgi:hypothetical protein|nr:uncharacterized protein [Desulfonauticus sp.]